MNSPFHTKCPCTKQYISDVSTVSANVQPCKKAAFVLATCVCSNTNSYMASHIAKHSLHVFAVCNSQGAAPLAAGVFARTCGRWKSDGSDDRRLDGRCSSLAEKAFCTQEPYFVMQRQVVVLSTPCVMCMQHLWKCENATLRDPVQAYTSRQVLTHAESSKLGPDGTLHAHQCTVSYLLQDMRYDAVGCVHVVWIG